MHTACDGSAPSPQLPPLGFGWISYLHLWLLLAATGLLAGLVAGAGLLQLNVTLQARGTLMPGDRTPIRSPEAGVVSRVLVGEGDSVAAGSVVVRLRTVDLERQLDLVRTDLAAHDRQVAQLRAQIAAERSRRTSTLADRRLQIDLAVQEVERVRLVESLYSDGRLPGWHRRPLEELIPVRRARESLQRARLALQAATTDLRQLETRQGEIDWLAATRQGLLARQAHLRRQIAARALRTPHTGIVRTGDLHRLEGAAVVAGQSLLEIATSADWEARLTVPADKWAKLSLRQPAQLFVDAYPFARYHTIPARVRRISGQPVQGPGTGYPVHLHITAADVGALHLAEGMAVTAHIIVDRGSVIDLAGAWLRRQFKGARPLQARLAALGGDG